MIWAINGVVHCSIAYPLRRVILDCLYEEWGCAAE